MPPQQSAPQYPAPPAQMPPQQPAPQYAPPAQVPPQQYAPPAGAGPAAHTGGPVFDPPPGVSEQVSSVGGKKNGAMRAGLAGTMALLFGAGGFATYSALSSPSGPSSPEEAIDAFMAAADAEDMLGMAELIAPSERETLAEPGLETLAHLQRLGIVDERGMTAEAGFDIEVDGMTYTVTTLNEELSWIEFTGGTLTATTTETAGLGPVVLDEIDEADRGALASAETTPLTDMPAIAIVEQDGGWYVSLTYTGAEHARREAGLGLPDFDASPVPDGAATPEAAVSELVAEMAEVDLEGILTHLDPVEFAAGYDYLPLVLDGAQRDVDAFLDEARAEGFTWALEVTSVRVIEQNGRTIAIIEGFEASASMGGDSVSMVIEGDCATVEVIGAGLSETATECGEAQAATVAESLVALGIDDPDIPSFVDKLEGLETGITVVERDGRWYVSMVPTYFGMINDVLERLERSDVDEGIEWFTDLAGEIDPLAGLGEPSGSTFVEIDDAISSGDDMADDGFDTIEDSIADPDPVDVASVLGVDVPSAEDVWDYDAATWWASTVLGGPPAEAYATLWIGFSWVDVVVVGTPGEALTTGDLLAEELGLVPTTLDGLPAGALVASNDSEVYVVADRYVMWAPADSTDELVLVVNEILG